MKHDSCTISMGDNAHCCHTFSIVSCPLTAHIHITIRRIRIAVITLVIFTFLFYLQVSFVNAFCFWYHHRYGCGATNSTTYEQIWVVYYNYMVSELLVAVIPMVLHICLGTALIAMYYNARRQSQQMLATRSKDEYQITVMTITIVLVLAICQLPSFASSIYSVTFTTLSHNHDNWTIVMSVAAVLTVVNSSVNFFIYSVCRTSFRVKLYNLLGCRGSAHDETPVRSPRHPTTVTNL